MIQTITEECNEFLEASNGMPLVKDLPKTYVGFRKVKIRKKNKSSPVGESFNQAFKNHKNDIHQSAMFAYTSLNILPENNYTEPFFVFPIDGYKFLYNTRITNSTKNYQNIGLNERHIVDLLNISYKSSNLYEALSSECEVILYGIPYYYAVRASLVDDYKSFFYS